MRWKRKKMNDMTKKLQNYTEETLEQIEEVQDATGYNFTEVQKMINDYFFSDDNHLDEVFGEEEDDEVEEVEE